MTKTADIRRLLTGGDRRSIADSHQVRRIVENDASDSNAIGANG
jgi:hypothetical protein